MDKKKYKSRSKSPRERSRDFEKKSKLKRKESSRERDRTPPREKKKPRLHRGESRERRKQAVENQQPKLLHFEKDELEDGNDYKPSKKNSKKIEFDPNDLKLERKQLQLENGAENCQDKPSFNISQEIDDKKKEKEILSQERDNEYKETESPEPQNKLNEICNHSESENLILDDADQFDIVSKNEVQVQSSEDSDSSSSSSDSSDSSEDSSSSSTGDGVEDEQEGPKNPHNFRQFLKDFAANPCNTLFYEPSGYAKELMADLISSECKTTFITVKGPELVNKAAIKIAFDRARASSPCIMFFQDLEYIAKYPSIIFNLYTEIKMSEEVEIFIVGIIKYSAVLPAYLQPLKFQKFVYVPLPDVNWRELMFKYRLKDWTVEEKNMKWLVEQTNGFTLHDIKKVADCVIAFVKSMNEYNEAVDTNEVAEKEPLIKKSILTKDSFQMALKLVQPSFSEIDELLHSEIFIQLVKIVKELQAKEENDKKRRQKIVSIYESVKKMKKENKGLLDNVQFIEKILTPFEDSSASYLDKEIERRMKSTLDAITTAKSAFKEIESKLFDLAEFEIP